MIAPRNKSCAEAKEESNLMIGFLTDIEQSFMFILSEEL